MLMLKCLMTLNFCNNEASSFEIAVQFSILCQQKLSQKTNAVPANGEILFVTPKQQDNLIALIQYNTSLNVSYQGEFFFFML